MLHATGRLLPGYVIAAALAACTPANRPDTDAGAAPGSSLRGTWNLVELAGTPAPRGAGGRPATLVIADTGSRATGFAGCNRIAGEYRVTADSIGFGALISTRMACEAGMELETRYQSALASARRYRVSSAGLELFGDSGTLARFERAAAP